MGWRLDSRNGGSNLKKHPVFTEEFCFIGGNVSTNAGGGRAVKRIVVPISAIPSALSHLKQIGEQFGFESRQTI